MGNYRTVTDDKRTAHHGSVFSDKECLDPNQTYSYEPSQSSQELQPGDFRRRHEDWQLNSRTDNGRRYIAEIRNVTDGTNNGLLAVNEAKKLER